jgi:hypothetical protein
LGDTVLFGKRDQIVEIPQKEWEKHLELVPADCHNRLAFMTEDHHRVRYFVVQELPIMGRPLEPEVISERLNLPLARTLDILKELEQGLFFLVRNSRGAVAWAFPVTVDTTPHRLTFESGEELFAA